MGFKKITTCDKCGEEIEGDEHRYLLFIQTAKEPHPRYPNFKYRKQRLKGVVCTACIWKMGLKMRSEK